MNPTDDFKAYLNVISGLIPDEIHNELWNRLIACITEKESLKRLLEFAEVPKIFIDNPTSLSTKATEKDIEWAKNKIKEL